MREPDELQHFEHIALPHLDAAYNLARWLTRNDDDAQDVVQEAYLRAFRAFDRYRGGDPRAWLLTIVRNTGYTWLRRNRAAETLLVLDDADDRHAEVAGDPALEPEAQVLRSADTQLLRAALEELPVEFREVLVLRELEGLSYKEIAAVTDVPIGTVMSRLARARRQLQRALAQSMKERA